MEKQPVDDLFARKLREAEAPVGPDVFNQLQKRMGGQPTPIRRPVVAWWHVASAACLLVALWFLYVINKVEPETSIPIAVRQAFQKLQSNGDDDKAIADATAKPELDQKRQHDFAVDEANKQQEEESIAQATYLAQRKSQTKLFNKPEAPTQTPVRPVETERIVATPEQLVQPIVEPSVVPINPVPVERIARVNNAQKQATERTILLTIEEPQLTNSLTAAKSDITTLEVQQPHQNGLSSLFGKLKQLKNGEVLAKAVPVSNQNNQKNRLGRVFSEVKESLKNETTLE
ncbi:hypothetical protein [uncultured Fibrella sp.]|uniref:hypothetical protein n=1 Tax=uncultured Fibrella sp. TaxID=1284596 RepID=UPI0035CA0C14